MEQYRKFELQNHYIKLREDTNLIKRKTDHLLAMEIEDKKDQANDQKINKQFIIACSAGFCLSLATVPLFGYNMLLVATGFSSMTVIYASNFKRVGKYK